MSCICSPPGIKACNLYPWSLFLEWQNCLRAWVKPIRLRRRVVWLQSSEGKIWLLVGSGREQNQPSWQSFHRDLCRFLICTYIELRNMHLFWDKCFYDSLTISVLRCQNCVLTSECSPIIGVSRSPQPVTDCDCRFERDRLEWQLHSFILPDSFSSCCGGCSCTFRCRPGRKK